MFTLKILGSPTTQVAIKSFIKPSLFVKTNPLSVRTQCLADKSRTAFRQATRRRTLKEIALQPASDTAFSLGKGAVAGASILGIGALCYYGLGLASEPGALEKSMLWPQYVRDRIKTTYMYFGGSLVITAASAVSIFQSPTLLRMMMSNSFLAIGATIAAVIGSVIIVRSMPYSEGFGPKQLAWMAHSGIMGAVIAPLCLLGGPLLMRAAWYTAGVVGGLSAVAVCAPSEKFLYMGGPLAIGFGFVFAASLGSMFLSPATALGAGLYSLSLYGGLVLFSGFLLYDTQRIIRNAEMYPQNYIVPFDPINASISIYASTLNIFIRIAVLLSGGGQRKK